MWPLFTRCYCLLATGAYPKKKGTSHEGHSDIYHQGNVGNFKFHTVAKNVAGTHNPQLATLPDVFVCWQNLKKPMMYSKECIWRGQFSVIWLIGKVPISITVGKNMQSWLWSFKFFPRPTSKVTRIRGGGATIENGGCFFGLITDISPAEYASHQYLQGRAPRLSFLCSHFS